MGKLKVGFGRADITPPDGLYVQGYYTERRGDGFLDRLTGSCIAFSDGEKTAVVFSLDLVGISQVVADELRRVVAERNSLPMEAVYFACTHTHTGPVVSRGGRYPNDEEYNSVMFRCLADAAKEALADLTEAEVYAARSKVEGISFVRRFRMKNGKTQTNPGIGNPEIEGPIGTPDEQLQLVRIVRGDKDEIVLINFQVHPDVIGGCKYSADYPGFVRRGFEGAVPGVKCVFFNGAQGDTNHINVNAPKERTGTGYSHSRHMGLSIVGEALKIYTYAEKVEGDKVDYVQHDIVVPSHRGAPEQLPLAHKYVEAHKAGRKEEIPYDGMEYVTVVAEASRMVRLENGPDSFTLHLNAVRFGDIAFSGIPGEPFTDIGRGIKEGSPFYMTFVNCAANGYQAYFPMKSAFDEGGYEARSSSFCAGIAETLIDESVKMLKELH